jgi:multidrug efflux system outer membrane protein
MRRVIFTLLIVIAGGCSMGPDYVRPPVPDPMAYRDTFPEGESIANTPWWELFADTVLQELIDSALVNNRDLRASLARIVAARANIRIVRSELFPRLDYFVDGRSVFATEGDNPDNEALATFNVSWQIDLWGRIRRSTEAALQQMLATEEAYRGLTIDIVAEVANAYLLLRDLDNRLLISQQTLEARQASLDVVKSRFNAGVVSEVDVNQAEILVAGAEVALYQFERQRAQTENAISLLIGVPPLTIPRGLPLNEQVLSPDVPTGLPSELLERRPDIVAAERQLHSQTALIGAAEALRFPQFTLTADLGGSFADQSVGFLDLGAQLFGPIYNAGEIRSRIDTEYARAEAAVNDYEQTILRAFREVEDAMIAVSTYREEYQARLRQVASAENAAELSWVRYEGGLTSYLEVLDLQRSLFNTQLSASLTRQLELTSIVQLYRALGGGWVAEQDSLVVLPTR